MYFIPTFAWINCWLLLQPVELHSITIDNRQMYTNSLFASALLGSSYTQATSKEMAAFSFGFNISVNSSSGLKDVSHPFIHRLLLILHQLESQMFGSTAQDLLWMAYSLKVTTPSQVINLCILQDLNFSDPAYAPQYGVDHDLDHADVGNLFMQKFARYLQGVGHLNHPQFRPTIIPLDEHVWPEKPTFCAERFLQLATDSELQPANRLS